jgi:hypothetical protein
MFGRGRLAASGEHGPFGRVLRVLVQLPDRLRLGRHVGDAQRAGRERRSAGSLAQGLLARLDRLAAEALQAVGDVGSGQLAVRELPGHTHLVTSRNRSTQLVDREGLPFLGDWGHRVESHLLEALHRNASHRAREPARDSATERGRVQQLLGDALVRAAQELLHPGAVHVLQPGEPVDLVDRVLELAEVVHALVHRLANARAAQVALDLAHLLRLGDVGLHVLEHVLTISLRHPEDSRGHVAVHPEDRNRAEALTSRASRAGLALHELRLPARAGVDDPVVSAPELVFLRLLLGPGLAPDLRVLQILADGLQDLVDGRDVLLGGHLGRGLDAPELLAPGVEVLLVLVDSDGRVLDVPARGREPAHPVGVLLDRARGLGAGHLGG